ncbi:MAG: hypothetical protein NC200_06680 [Candidatus Gastranaerophilales bacterium]|nr:hypothetical protein [Candidatus Gastranaerophilales bacterium]
MKKLCLVVKNRTDVVESVFATVTDTDIIVVSEFEELDVEVDLIAFVENFSNIENIKAKNILNIHPSLLPSFPEPTAIKDAYLAGVKVSGVTVYKYENSEQKILAQYPVLIDNYTHYDELELEIHELEAKLYPLVIKSVLEDKVFDIVDLLDGGNHQCGGCGNCGGCYHN